MLLQNGQSNVLTAYVNAPLITEEEVKKENVDIKKAFDYCDVFYCG